MRVIPLLPTLLFLGAILLGGSLAPAQTGVHPYAPPAFADQARRQRVEAVLPEIDKLYTELAAAEHLPGLVYGVVLDGELIHARAAGLADLERKIPVNLGTRFRIASMTKSFVAMAALKLRDEGKLRLDDPVEKYLPEFHALHALTTDSPALTIRNLMTMTTGLPEDNPWGDRQIELTSAGLAKLVSGGLSFSNPPNQTYEYSNLGFVLLGKVVSKVSSIRFQDYITKNIFRPLGMTHTVWEYSTIPAGEFALGYRWVNNTWVLEPVLHDGDSAAMSGLITTLEDFSRYVAFHLSAWPARNDPDHGPVRRSTVREMQQPRVFSTAAPTATLLDGKTPNPAVGFYGYGLSWNRDSQNIVRIGHSGGLPGYGSMYRFAPDHGVAVIAFSNLRYGPVYAPTGKALNLLLEHANLPARTIATSAILATRQKQVAELIQSWDPALTVAIAADNFFLDRPREEWIAESREKLGLIGRIVSTGAIEPENQLRGKFSIVGEKGTLQVKFTLTPERDPKLQDLKLTVVPKP